MHTIEPHYSWRELYTAEEDKNSPFYGREYSEFEFSHSIYNYVIHPQWDFFGSQTLYLKILYADYENGTCIIQLMGEWNDCINNDIMFLKRDVIDHLISNNITKFILIGDNVLNFHYSDDCYYQEWFEDIEDGWIAGLNFRAHVQKEFEKCNIDYYIAFGGELGDINWTTFSPMRLIEKVETLMTKRLQP